MAPVPHNMIPADVITPLLPIVDALDACGILYYIGGSVASSVWGIPRSTLDADIVADMRPAHVAPFVAAIEADFYVDALSIQEAIRARRSFNVIHMDQIFKIDVFVHERTPFAHAGFAHIAAAAIDADPPRTVAIASAENTLLHKLTWYRMGGETSERQWGDILGILKMQPDLDQAYLQQWAARLQVTDLLARALADAGG